jgi:predicted metal-dependent enzyme (double-stranded beta helix superfamily)
VKYLDADMLQLCLNAVEYKPGWRFTIHQHKWEGLCVDIAVSLPNGYRPDQEVDVNIRVPVPPIVSPEHFHDWLMWRLARVEMHEMREFYHVNGTIRDDPHAEEVSMV